MFKKKIEKEKNHNSNPIRDRIKVLRPRSFQTCTGISQYSSPSFLRHRFPLQPKGESHSWIYLSLKNKSPSKFA